MSVFFSQVHSDLKEAVAYLNKIYGTGQAHHGRSPDPDRKAQKARRIESCERGIKDIRLVLAGQALLTIGTIGILHLQGSFGKFTLGPVHALSLIGIYTMMTLAFIVSAISQVIKTMRAASK